MDNNQYTAGDLSQLTGISTRTIRFYDQKGLLKPIAKTEAGYRLYNQQSLLTLQRILVFKHLGFSLNDIEEMLNHPDHLSQYLTKQKNEFEKQLLSLKQKLNILDLVVQSNSQNQWNTLVNLCYNISNEDAIKQQYASTEGLQNRINIHKYSTSPIEWFDFMKSHMDIHEGNRILEIGCGTGLLWEKLINDLPNHLTITLTDYSEKMLDASQLVFAKHSQLLKEKNIQVNFKILDANDFTLEKESYDLIIANHVLYHVTNRQRCIKRIYQALKPTGTFYCSTIGEHHMEDMFLLLSEFDDKIENPHDPMTSAFRLENAKEQLQTYFKHVQRYDHDSNLFITEVQPIIDYVASLTGNAHYIVSKRQLEFENFIQNIILEEGGVFVGKSTGMFICAKCHSE